jgi:GntR family transcriptional regulator
LSHPQSRKSPAAILSTRGIERNSPVPFYYQLRQLLEHELRSGQLEVGERLPSEAMLCAQYDVSRTVVRQTLSDLESTGLISRIKGRGSFVSAPKTPEHLVQALTSLYEDVQKRGQRLETKVLRLEVEPASPYVAEALGVSQGVPLILLERLRYVDGEPWVLTTAYLPEDICAPLLEVDLERRPLYQTLEQELGLQLHRGTRSVETAQAGREIAKHLGIAEGAPVLVLTGTTYLVDNRPIEYFVGIHRGDRSRFEVELFRPETGADHHPPTLVALPEPSA